MMISTLFQDTLTLSRPTTVFFRLRMLSHATTIALSNVGYNAMRRGNKHCKPTASPRRPASSALYKFSSDVTPGTMPPPSIHSTANESVQAAAAVAVAYSNCLSVQNIL